MSTPQDPLEPENGLPPPDAPVDTPYSAYQPPQEPPAAPPATNAGFPPGTAMVQPPIPPQQPQSPGYGNVYSPSPTLYPPNFRRTSGMAIASMVFGIVSFPMLCFCFGILTAIPAVILGHLALSEITNNPSLDGRGMAITGLILGYLIVGIFVFSILASVLSSSGPTSSFRWNISH